MTWGAQTFAPVIQYHLTANRDSCVTADVILCDLFLLVQVVSHILSFLHPSDRKEASLVCRSWYEASRDHRFQVIG